MQAASNFILRFVYDDHTKQSTLIGSNGVVQVDTYMGDRAVSFAERLSSGAIQTTTITFQSRIAVHSRHTLVGIELVPTQYYGKCR